MSAAAKESLNNCYINGCKATDLAVVAVDFDGKTDERPARD